MRVRGGSKNVSWTGFRDLSEAALQLNDREGRPPRPSAMRQCYLNSKWCWNLSAPYEWRCARLETRSDAWRAQSWYCKNNHGPVRTRISTFYLLFKKVKFEKHEGLRSTCWRDPLRPNLTFPSLLSFSRFLFQRKPLRPSPSSIFAFFPFYEEQYRVSYLLKYRLSVVFPAPQKRSGANKNFAIMKNEE